MQNYDQFKKMRSEFDQGLQFGSSERENSQYIDSIAGRLNNLKAVWTSIGTTVMNSDFIKGMLDGLISFSEGIDTVIQALDGLGLASSAAFGLMGGFFGALKNSISSSRSVATGMSDISRGMTQTATASGRLGGTLSKMSGFMGSFIKQGLLIAGVTAVVQGLGWAWEKATNGLKNAAEELKAVENAQLTEINTGKEKVRTLETIGREYETLASKAKKTSEEQARMLELGNELARVLPEIQIGTDSDGNAIISMTTDMQGYIDKTNDAIAAQERLMLATNRERAENALKQKSKGELLDRVTGKGGLDKQALKEQQDYNQAWTDLETQKIKTMNWLRESEGKEKIAAMKQLQDINNAQLKLEGEHGNKLAEINSQRMEGLDAFRDYANSLVTTGMDSIVNSTPEMKQAAQEFVNSLDFSEINTEQDLANVQRILSELPQMLDSGKLNIDNLRGDLSKINEEFSKTQNIEKYNADMRKLAETISQETGWDVDTLTNMFTKMDNMFLQSKGSLEDYLTSFGSSMGKLKNGDALAKALQSQYDSIQNYITQISNMPDSVEKQMELVVDLKNDETLPSQIREMVATMEDSGMSSDAILTITAQAMIDWKDGGFDPNSLEFIRQGIESQLMQDGMTFEQAVEVSTDIVMNLGTMDKESVLKEIDEGIGETEVTKEVRIETHGEEKAKEIEESISLLESRPDVNKKVQTVVEGEEDLILFKDIIENLPVNEEYTNKFIIDNAKALSDMNSWKEVQDWVNSQPKEFKQKYGIEVEGEDDVENVVSRLNDELGEIPETVKTIIETEGIVAINNARLVLETYQSIPEEVRTVLSSNGMETLSDITMVDMMLKNLPPQVVTNILTNFPEVVQGASSLEDLIMSLPSSVLLEIQSNYPEVVEKSKLLQDAIDKIPATKESTISVKEEIQKSPSGIFDRLFGKDKSDMTATAVINAQVNNIESVKELDSLLSRFGGGGGSSSGGGGKRSVEQYSVTPLDENIPSLLKSSSGGSSGGGSGFNVNITATVNGIEDVQSLQNTLDSFNVQDIKATISISTAQSAQNLSGLINRIEQTKSALNGLTSKNVNINTALAAQNLSGLIARCQQYIGTSIADKTCNIHTAQAAKNISGLIAKINQVNGIKPKPIVFTAHTAQAAKNISGLIARINQVPTSKTITFKMSQSGSIPNVSGGTFSYGVQTSTDIQAQTLGIQSQLRDGISANPITVGVGLTRDKASSISDYFEDIKSHNIESKISLVEEEIGDKWIDSMREVADILEKLTINDVLQMSTFSEKPSYAIPNSKVVSQKVEFNQPLMVVNGNIDKEVLPDIEKAMGKLKKDIINEINNGDVRKKRLEGR